MNESTSTITGKECNTIIANPSRKQKKLLQIPPHKMDETRTTITD
jgi:hypothetical protein